MKIKYIAPAILFSLFINLASVFAAWIDYEPQTIQQPDGTVISCYATGDEFYNWLHDQEGYTIIQNHADGYYYYAQLVQGQLSPSSLKAGSGHPSTIGLVPWLNISRGEMANYRKAFYAQHMPARKPLPGYPPAEGIQNEGTLNNLVVYIRFEDQTEFDADTLFYYNMYNNTSSGYNSMQNYFETVSYDMISIPSWFYPVPPDATVISYQDIYPRSYFMPYDPVTNPNGYQSGQNVDREHGLLKRACEYIEDEVPATLNIDKDNDGYIDNMVFTVRGATTAWSTLLWPHRWVLYSQNVFINGKKVWDYNLQVENHLNGQGAGVLCHEMFHSLSAPDLYHYNSAPYTSVGPWDLMDNANNPPESMGAYMKYRYGGWIESIPEITECGTYTLNPLSEAENNCFKIVSPNNPSQYYVLEYRVKEGTFEGNLPGTGLLVYRIDNTLNGEGNAQGPPDEVYVYRPNGTTTTNGNLSQAHFAADYDRTAINDNTNPAPFLQNGQPGGLNIANVGYAGETISFDVLFEKEPVAGFSVSQELATPGCALDFYDASFCEVNSWEWTFEGAETGSSTEQHPQGIVWNSPGTYNVSLVVSNDWGTDNLTKTAYIEISETALPEVVFFASDSVSCTNEIVHLQDFSGVCPSSWSWEITPSSYGFVNGTGSTSQHADIVLMDATEYTVSLTVTNDNGSQTLTKENYLLAGGADLPFEEDFEGDAPESAGWVIENPDEGITWEVFQVSGNGGEQAAGINLFNYFSIFKRDRLITPPINLSNTAQAYLLFDHAYALGTNTQFSDSLLVKVSTDCGENWTTVLSLAEDGSMNFATHMPTDFSFVPASADDWCGSVVNASCNVVDLSPWTGSSDTRIMFESVRLTGNNLYIDNVVVSTTTGLPETIGNGQDPVRIYPNPASGLVSVSTGSQQYHTITVSNSMGQVISRQQLSGKQQTLTVDLNSQARGLYFMVFEGNGIREIKKLVLH